MTELHFVSHGNLVNILGTQLIDELSVAVLELVKNSYDADATVVDVKLDKVYDPTDAIVIVHDNGHGMTLADIRDRWLVAGFSEKEGQVFRHQRTARGRFPLGRMGIGRFAAARLGSRLIMVTRAAGNPELRVDIDWDALSRAADLSRAPISVVESPQPSIFREDATGTRIAIRKPRQPWTTKDLSALQTQLLRFVSPHTSLPDFKIRLSIPAAPEFENLDKKNQLFNAHFEATAEIAADGNAKFSWRNRLTGESDQEQLRFLVRDQFSPRTDRIAPRCGPLKVQLLAWKRTKTELRSFGIDDPKHLDALTGISIFRDEFRVLPYGDPGHDWLDLNLRRVNSPTERFSTNQVLGSIYITTTHNPNLRDQANRLGLMDNIEYRDFKEVVLQVIDKLEERVLRKKRAPRALPQNIEDRTQAEPSPRHGSAESLAAGGVDEKKARPSNHLWTDRDSGSRLLETQTNWTPARPDGETSMSPASGAPAVNGPVVSEVRHRLADAMMAVGEALSKGYITGEDYQDLVKASNLISKVFEKLH